MVPACGLVVLGEKALPGGVEQLGPAILGPGLGLSDPGLFGGLLGQKGQSQAGWPSCPESCAAKPAKRTRGPASASRRFAPAAVPGAPAPGTRKLRLQGQRSRQARAWVEPGRCLCHPASAVGERKQKEGRSTAGAWPFPLQGGSTGCRGGQAAGSCGQGPPVVLRPGFQSCFCPVHAAALGKDNMVPSLLGSPSKIRRKAPLQN